MDEVEGQCQKSNGFAGCECNIMGACDVNGKPKPRLDYKLTGYAPSGLQQFGGFAQGDKQNLAYLCEDGVVAILYDCKNRVPLYAATVMDETELYANYQRKGSFKPSSKTDQYYQAKDDDYSGSSTVKVCYKKPENAPSLIDCEWYRALNDGEAILEQTECKKVAASKTATAIHRGHLIAASYGRENIKSIKATFKYTNTISQFAKVNTGRWNNMEQTLVNWGKKNCHHGSYTENVRMHIIVGPIPSTYKPGEQRYFGRKGFANYQSEDFRINVPSATWTVACCTFQFKDGSGNYHQGTRHTFFALKNAPKAFDELPKHSDKFFQSYLSPSHPESVVLFPNNGGCKEEGNYVPLKK